MAFKLQGYMSLLLLSVCLHFMTENRTAAISIREKCECIEETGSVRWRKIKDYTIIPKDSFCNKVQIKLQLSDKQLCLNPESKQGVKLQKCWERIKLNTRQKKVCLTFKKKKNGPKSPKKH